MKNTPTTLHRFPDRGGAAQPRTVGPVVVWGSASRVGGGRTNASWYTRSLEPLAVAMRLEGRVGCSWGSRFGRVS
jgi:hypothetical protein